MKRYVLSIFSMFVMLIFLLWVSICQGSVSLEGRQVLDILFGKIQEGTAYHIIWDIRLPRILAAAILGGALSVSGFLLQNFFQNPIAGPYVLGVSSGAKLVVALVMIFLLGRGKVISSFGMVMAAFAGSMIAMGFVLLLSFRIQKMSLLVVCGIMIGYICSAITDFCITFANDSNIVNLHNWSMGSFSGINWSNVKVMSMLTVVCVIIVFFLSKPMGAYQLGENYARNMGVNIKALRILLILLSSMLSACVTAFAGPISFVGIAVPHLVKTMTKTSKPNLLTPGCFLA